MENLRKVEDVADEKVKRYGVEVVTAIEQFCKQNSTSMDLMPSQDFDLPKVIFDVSRLTLFGCRSNFGAILSDL